jgi:transposase-like protein
MTISKERLDELLKGCERPEDLLGEAGLMKEFKIKLMERMLGAELTAHLGYEETRRRISPTVAMAAAASA